MTTRLYYGAHLPRGYEPDDLTRVPLPPDGDFYLDDEGESLPVNGIRLTREPKAWWRTSLLVAIDVPLDDAALAPYRVAWDTKHESYDLPCEVVNASRRTWVRDPETVVGLMLSYGEDECGERCG